MVGGHGEVKIRVFPKLQRLPRSEVGCRRDREVWEGQESQEKVV